MRGTRLVHAWYTLGTCMSHARSRCSAPLCRHRRPSRRCRRHSCTRSSVRCYAALARRAARPCSSSRTRFATPPSARCPLPPPSPPQPLPPSSPRRRLRLRLAFGTLRRASPSAPQSAPRGSTRRSTACCTLAPRAGCKQRRTPLRSSRCRCYRRFLPRAPRRRHAPRAHRPPRHAAEAVAAVPWSPRAALLRPLPSRRATRTRHRGRILPLRRTAPTCI